MVAGARQLRTAVERYPNPPTISVMNRSAAGLEDEEGLFHWPAPKLVITSPPYPGVHVLYHRWQVDGRKEAPLPFMIANKLDGAGSSYYTMGDRKYPALKTYFNNVRATMSSVAAHRRREHDDCSDGRILGLFLAARTLSRDDGGGRSVRGLSANASW